MKKRIAALLCTLTLLLGAVPIAGALEGESQRAAETLAAIGLLEAVPAAASLEEPSTRVQAAELLTRLYGVTQAQREVSAQDYAIDQGWLTVTGQQQEPIPANEICAALLRQLGWEDVEEASAHLLARRLGLVYQNYEGPLTQGELFQLVRDSLTYPDTKGVTAAQRLVDKGIASQAAVKAQGLLDEEFSARQIADRYLTTAFCLDTYYTESHYQRGIPDNGGSGFFISEDGLAVTNYHTIDEAVRATAQLITGETYEVTEVVAYDREIDFAILRISRTSTEGKETPCFASLDLVENAELHPGDKVYTLGNPLGLGLAISDGIISAVDRVVENFALPCIMNTADISNGSSGGALLNICGRVVGITTGAYSYGNNMYIAVPVTPLLEADWEAEGISLAQVAEEVDAAKAAEKQQR